MLELLIYCLPGNHAAPIAQAALCIVNHGKLPGRNALHIGFAFNHPLAVAQMREFGFSENGGVAILKGDFHRSVGILPGISGDEVHFVEV